MTAERHHDAPDRTTTRRPKHPFALAAEHVLFGVGTGIASTVYGTVVVMATLTAAHAADAQPWEIATIVASTVVVLWIAHVYAHALSRSITESRLSFAAFRGITRGERGILLAAVLPVLSLALGAVGVFGERTAVWLALGIGLFTLGMEGVRYSRLEKLGLAATLGVTAANLALGLLVVALKVAVAH